MDRRIGRPARRSSGDSLSSRGAGTPSEPRQQASGTPIQPSAHLRAMLVLGVLACVAGVAVGDGDTTVTLGPNATDGERYVAAHLRSLLRLPLPPALPKNDSGLAEPAGHAVAAVSTVRTDSSSNTAAVYIDNRGGDDTNSGLSPTTAWRSLARLRKHQLQPGGAVRFARGGQWRGFLIAQGGNVSHGPVTYGAYGDTALEKPVLLGSIAPTASDWQAVPGRIGVWAANISLLSLPVVGSDNSVTDVGNLILASGSSSPDVKLGRKVWAVSALASPFDFYFDRSSKTLLLLSPEGNPALSVHGTIECALVWLVCSARTGPNSCAPCHTALQRSLRPGPRRTRYRARPRLTLRGRLCDRRL